ncbi:PH domain-containing protein [Isoptericola sp. 4D.3]|uniref:PH domain-containing protein n=1 Tax=Isoptericola peretonis TaxID=2918523 RepID=A0ABT0J242_9MICO|nr:PH domain-containing protein [Isoptericola sp. 4D.3]
MSSSDASHGTAGAGPARDGDRFRVFRPLWGRVAAWVVWVLAAVGSLVVGLTASGPLGAAAVNRVSFVVFALGVTWLLWRLGGVHAVPSPERLRVRNLVQSRDLDWAEIVEVRLGPDDPWVRLDLADGGTLAVMGIQRADGERGMAEARRLRSLVVGLGEAPDRS